MLSMSRLLSITRSAPEAELDHACSAKYEAVLLVCTAKPCRGLILRWFLPAVDTGKADSTLSNQHTITKCKRHHEIKYLIIVIMQGTLE